MYDERNEKYIYSRISENDAGAAGIFYGKLCLAILTGDATLKNKAVSVIYNHQYRGDTCR